MNRSKIEYMLSPGESPETAKEFVAQGVAANLVSRFFEWPRHRWRGADLAVNSFGLLSAIHGLLEHVFPLFVESFKTSSKGNAFPDLEAMPAAASSGPPASAAAASSGPPESAPAGADAAPLQLPGEPSGPEAPAASQKTAEDNVRFRSKGLSWVQSGPLDQLTISRLIMEPLRVLLDKKLFVGSRRWELSEQAKAAKAARNGEWPGRDFPVTVASKNLLENEFFQKLGLLLNPNMWLSIIDVSEKSQALIFKLMSRAGCMVEELLRSQHLLAHFSTFQAIWDRTAATRIAAVSRRCLLDPMSLELVSKYKEEEFGNDESRLKLFCIALKARTDISHLESLHAWVRKCLVLRTQGWGMTMPDLSAIWTLGRHRSNMPKSRSPSDGQGEEECEEPMQKQPRTNSWNLFCRRRCSGPDQGRRKDWKAASRAYRSLSEGELAALVKETKEAKAKATAFGLKPGQSIFGEKHSRQLRNAIRHATAIGPVSLGHGQDQLADDNAETTPHLQSIVQALEKLPVSITLDALYKQATKLERSGWGKKQAQDRQAEIDIQNWLDSLDSQQSLSLKTLSEGLAGSSSALQPRPGAFPDGGILSHNQGDQGQGALRLVSYIHSS